MVGRLRSGKFSVGILCVVVLWTARLVAAPWLPFGPDGGDARRIAPDPSDHAHLYLGTANGWIYESHNSGSSWVRVAQIGKRDDLVLDSIVVDSADPKHLLVGAWVIDHPDGGLFTSTDGGMTWLNQAEMRGQSVRALTASRSDPKVLVAGSLQGVFRSTDAGQHWNRISPADSTEIHEIQSVAIDPKDASVIYAGTWHLPWKTTDAGGHWESMKQGIIDDSDVFSIIVDPTSPQTVYASACSGIYKSDDAGGLFHKVQGIPSTARRTRVLLQDPHHLDTVFAGTTEGLFRSEDAGKSWTRTTGPEIIVNDVLVDLADPQRVLLATNRGGVMASDDGGDTFHSSNGGFSARQITTLKRDLNHSSKLFVGVVNDKDWGGVFESDNGGVNWVQRSDGLQGRDVFALGQAPDGTMIAGTAHGIYRLDSTSQTWERVENAPAGPPTVATTHPSVPNLTRAPVPIGRNLFVQRNSVKTNSLARRKAALGSAKHPTSNTSLRVSRKKAQSSAMRKGAGGSSHGTVAATAKRSASLKTTGIAYADTSPAPPPSGVEVAPPTFDGGVYSIVTAGRSLLAATSAGLLSSSDNGVSWTAAGPEGSSDWRLLAAAKANVVAASLHSVQFSPDSGTTWSPVKLPRDLTQVSAIAVEPSGEIWVGSREGVFVSSDGGSAWSTPKNLYVNSVNSIFYDESASAVTVTAAGNHGIVFTVQLPQRSVAYYESGWTLRFARPVGDHLVAATLFDGLVIQPRMSISPIRGLPSGAAVLAPPPTP